MNTPTRNRLEMMRDEMLMHDRIAALLREAPRTIPEVAEALHQPSAEVVCWMMSLRRYGRIEEEGRPDADGYSTYVWKDPAEQDTEGDQAHE